MQINNKERLELLESKLLNGLARSSFLYKMGGKDKTPLKNCSEHEIK